MMGRKLKVGFIILLLVLSLVPAYTVIAEDMDSDGNDTDTGDTSAANNTTVIEENVTNPSVNATSVAAEVLLRNLERLQNYTSSLINGTEDVGTEVLGLYEQALNLTEEAKALYEEGEYKESLHTSILAMKTYKEVIRGIRFSTKPEREMEMERVRVEARRTLQYLKHVEALIRAAERKGVDVSNVTELYNQTRLAYTKLLENAEANNTTAINAALEEARALKTQLEMELRNLHKQFAAENAEKMARAFETRLEVIEKALERMKKRPGVNETDIENVTQELDQLKAQLEQLISEGKYSEVLRLIKEAMPELKRAALHLNWIEKDEKTQTPAGGPKGNSDKGKGSKGRGH